MTYLLSPHAKDDLDDISDYIANRSGSEDVADRFIDLLTARFHLIACNPYIGRRRDDLRPHLRSFPVGEYLIFYRVENDNVRILRVAHGNRDIASLLG